MAHFRLHKTRGYFEKEDIISSIKHFTINIGISLGNKWFTPDNTLGLIKWTLNHSDQKVIFNIVDSLHVITVEVIENISKEKASERVKAMVDDFMAKLKPLIESNLTEEERDRIIYTTWNDVITPEYQAQVNFLYEYYEKNEDFKNTIYGFVHNYIARKGAVYSDQNIHKLGSYIIEELPEITACVPIAGIVCDAYVYPFDGEVTRMVEKIQKGEIFPEIREKILNTKPKVLLEVR